VIENRFMSQNQRRPKPKLERQLHSVQIKQPMVRDYSTGGGHLPGDTIIEGDEKIVTKKWQGYPPQNLNVLGKPMPPLAEVAIPRFTGKAEYATRVQFPNMLFAKLLTSPHPRARIRSIDTSRAEKMPGVAHVLTYMNSLMSYPVPRDLNFQGEVVAIVVADTEDLAEDAVEVIAVDYEVLPFASSLQQVMAPSAPDLRQGRGNLIKMRENDPHYDANATWVAKHGDIEKGFAEADLIREYSYSFGSAMAVPLQPCGSVAKWDGDKLTFWGMSQGIYPPRDALARRIGVEPSRIRFVNKWNGGTFGGSRSAERLYPYIAHLARVTNRPVKLMLPKDQELAQMQIKPETLTKFKVGTKNGRIVALQHELHVSNGDTEAPSAHATQEVGKEPVTLYTTGVPNWKSTSYTYKTNNMANGAVRSYTQQEIRFAWESMIDEMAEAAGIDPVQFRLMHVPKPGTKLSPAKDWHAQGLGSKYEIENGSLTFDSYASVEVLEEGAKVIEWSRRSPKPGGAPGRFKRGIGLGMSQHHSGQLGYHEGEIYFEKRLKEAGGQPDLFTADVEIDAVGNVTVKTALPDSGTNHGSGMAALVAEMLGFTTRDRIRLVWGDTELAPASSSWFAGRTITLQGGAVCAAADKLRKDLLRRAADAFKVEIENLVMRDGVISVGGQPARRMTFAELVKANKGIIRQSGRCMNKDQGRSMTKGIGTCFAEVEVDTWTGDWRFLKAVYCHDTGFAINPLLAEADMEGSLVQSFQMTTDPLPYDREFPGTRHYSVGYLSYRIPTIMDVPEQTQVFIDSLEPRWFFGIKSFSETTIGAVPGAIANAIYNACGVRIREHPITREKIMAGLKTL
jgi:CO/xanthine dehydrogenase Mo-binding subunit